MISVVSVCTVYVFRSNYTALKSSAYAVFHGFSVVSVCSFNSHARARKKIYGGEHKGVWDKYGVENTYTNYIEMPGSLAGTAFPAVYVLDFTYTETTLTTSLHTPTRKEPAIMLNKISAPLRIRPP